MREDKDDTHEEEDTLRPSRKMQWAFFKVVTGLTCLMIAVSLVVFLVSHDAWSLIGGGPMLGVWLAMAKHLFPQHQQHRKREHDRAELPTGKRREQAPRSPYDHQRRGKRDRRTTYHE